MKILKNTTDQPILLDSGIGVPANAQVMVDQPDYLKLAEDETLYTAIISGDVIVNDGNSDLTKVKAIQMVASAGDAIAQAISGSRLRVAIDTITKVKRIQEDYAATVTDDKLACEGTMTITLPDATIPTAIEIKNAGTGVITIQSSQLIDKQESYQIVSPEQSVEVVSDGVTWLLY